MLGSLNLTPNIVGAYRKPIHDPNYDAFSSAFFALEPRSFGSGSSFFGLCDSRIALARATASCRRSAL